eukprot:c24794_g4_i1 orf=3-566(-)
MAAAPLLSYISPRTSPAMPCYSAANCTVLAGRKYEIPYHNPCRPVADVHARGRRKTTTEKKRKLGGSRRQGKSWPTDGITADIREPRKTPAPNETVSISLEQQESSDNRIASAFLEKTPSKEQHHLNDKKSAPISDHEKSSTGGRGFKSKVSVAVENEDANPHTSHNTVEMKPAVGNSSLADDNVVTE